MFFLNWEVTIKRILKLVCILFIFCLIPDAWAKEGPRWVVGLKAGYFSPEQNGWDEIYGDGNVDGFGQLGLKISPNWEVGIEGGYFTDRETSRTPSGIPSTAEQEIHLIPVNLFLIYNAVFKENQPVIPFAGGGYSHVVFIQSLEGRDTFSGDRIGFHGRAGIKILLDPLDPAASEDLEIHWGMRNTYFVMEAQYRKIDDFGGDATDFGGWSYLGGILIEF